MERKIRSVLLRKIPIVTSRRASAGKVFFSTKISLKLETICFKSCVSFIFSIMQYNACMRMPYQKSTRMQQPAISDIQGYSNTSGRTEHIWIDLRKFLQPRRSSLRCKGTFSEEPTLPFFICNYSPWGSTLKESQWLAPLEQIHSFSTIGKQILLLKMGPHSGKAGYLVQKSKLEVTKIVFLLYSQ